MSREVVIIKTGTANLASVLAAWKRLDLSARLSVSAHDVRDAQALMVPGVGAFGAAMQGLQDAGLVDALRARVDAGRPTLGICVGMQVFCEASAESPGVRGIGAVAGTLEMFGRSGASAKPAPKAAASVASAPNVKPASVAVAAPRVNADISKPLRVPQLGWNEVVPDAHCAMVEPGYAYYANSYRLGQAPRDWSVARTSHGAPFVAALERGPVLLCQFHPELSGAWGASLLRRFWEGAR